MYHSFLIHSSADGHLGCFHVLAIINSAAMNIGVILPFKIKLSFEFIKIIMLVHGFPWWPSGKGSVLSKQRTWIQSLVGELRSCMQCGAAKKKKKKRKECLFNFSEICINILVSNDTETRIKTNIPLHTLSCFPLQK